MCQLQLPWQPLAQHVVDDVIGGERPGAGAASRLLAHQAARDRVGQEALAQPVDGSPVHAEQLPRTLGLLVRQGCFT